MIKGHGNSNSPYMLIGDYPSLKEVKDNEAFSLISGPGRMMKDLLGTRFNSFYKTLFAKTDEHDIPGYLKELKRKKNVSLSDFFPDCFEYERILWDEIDIIKPSFILSVGEIALNILTEEKKIQRFRGSILKDKKTKQIPIIPIYSQRDIYAVWPRFVITQCDINKALRVIKEGYTEFDQKYSIWVCNSISDLRDFIKRGRQSMGKRAFPEFGLPKGFLTFDVETRFNMITCISLCFDGKEAISVSLLDSSIKDEEMEMIWTEIAQLMQDPRIPKVNQNIKYDDHCLNILTMNVANIVGDTMILSSVIYPELPKGLDFLTSIYTDMPYYKDEGREFDPRFNPYSQYQLYNAKDALAVHQIYPQQLEEAKESGVLDFYTGKVWPLYNLYKSIDTNGILIDLIRREELYIKYTGLFENVCKNMEEFFGHKINPLSPDQISKIVYEEMGLPKQYKKRTNGVYTLSTDEESLEWIVHNETDDELTKKILGYFIMARKLQQLITFIKSFVHPDGRMRTNTKLTGPKTGRTSTSETTDFYYIPKGKKIIQKNLGTAFQKIPRRGHIMPDGTIIGSDIMEMFIPSPGYVFVEADLKQAEARRVCILAEDIEFLETFDIPPGVHRRTAGWVCDMNPEDVIKGSDPYDKGKRARHAGNYDQSPQGLSIMAHIALTEAEIILQRFHENQPNIHGIYHEGIRTVLKQTKTLTNAFGRVRNFFDRLSDKVFREGYAQLPQSEISDHLKFDIMSPIYKDWKWVRFQAEKHDGFLAEVPENHLDEFCERVHELSQTTINCRVSSLPKDYDLYLPIEIEWSDKNWKEKKEWKS